MDQTTDEGHAPQQEIKIFHINERFWTKRSRLNKVQRRIIDGIIDEVSDHEFLDTVEHQNSGVRPPSLRLVQYVRGKHFPAHPVVINGARVADGYLIKLAHQGRKNLDSFRRCDTLPKNGVPTKGMRTKVFYYSRDGVECATTVGQLSLLHWAVQTGSLQYIRDNHDVLMLAMVRSGARQKKVRKAAGGGRTMSKKVHPATIYASDETISAGKIPVFSKPPPPPAS